MVVALAFAVLCAADPAPDALLKTHCLVCHSGPKPKGDFDLSALSRDIAANAAAWQGVLDRLADGSMPPAGKPRPSAADAKAITDWLTPGLATAAASVRGLDGRTVLRRLNRDEYQNSLRDLLGIDLDIKAGLPDDITSHGFDSVGAALVVSPALLERYLEAADVALDLATASRPQPKPVKARVEIDRTPEKLPRSWFVRPDALVMFNTGYPPGDIKSLGRHIAEPGRYRVRVSAYAYQSPHKPVTMSVHSFTYSAGRSSVFLGEFETTPEPTVFEAEAKLVPGEMLKLQAVRLGYREKIDATTYTGPGLAVQWAEVEGPLGVEEWPPAGHRLLWGDCPLEPIKGPPSRRGAMLRVTSKQPAADAETLLRGFLPQAYRRPVTDADVRPVLKLVTDKLAAGATFEEAMRVGYMRALCGPDFLFRREPAGRLDDVALANRLSYFLWGGPPDAELMSLAVGNKLGTAATLREQTERLLNDPKADRFVARFCGQWLDLDRLDDTTPDKQLYPEYDEALRHAMPEETLRFFATVLKHDRPLLDFVDSRWAVLNNRLAKHYGITGVDGPAFREVPLPAGSPRGGVLTHASVLNVTANGTTTSPVVRGRWVLERILGQHVNPPPPNVPAVEPDIRGATTIREQLAKHRAVETCAGCHRKIDPPGFALEAFDPIGGHRDRYRSLGAGKPSATLMPDGVGRVRYRDGPPVDAGDTLPDGRAFRDLAEFKALVLATPEPVIRGFADRLVTYATGAAPTAADRAAVDALVTEANARKYGLRTLVHALVQSELFRNK